MTTFPIHASDDSTHEAIDFPSVRPAGESLHDHFRRITVNGLLGRLTASPDRCAALNCSRLLSDLDNERRDLARVGFLSYFLVAADIVAQVPQDTPVVARFGDWRHSVTAFALGITPDTLLQRHSTDSPLSVCPLLTLGYGAANRPVMLTHCWARYGRDCVAVAVDPYREGLPADLADDRLIGFAVTASPDTITACTADRVQGFPVIRGDELDLFDHGLIMYRLPTVLAGN